MRIAREETAQAQEWAGAAFGPDRAPFSFVYGGESSAELLPKWSLGESARQISEQRTERTLTWTDPATGLQVRCVAVTYRDWPAVEWTVYLKNTGAEDTPILEDIQGLDARFAHVGEGEFLLHYHSGDWCHPDGYEPHRQLMPPNLRWNYAPEGGRASDTGFSWPSGGRGSGRAASRGMRGRE